MRKISTMAVALMVTLGILGSLSLASSPEDETIKKVMKAAMKGGLLKKVADGKATQEQKAELVKLLEGMAKATPPKGDGANWKKLNDSLVQAAHDAADNKKGALAQLKKASNCKSCHDAHK